MLESVAETFWPMRPLLPIPVTTTRPAQPKQRLHRAVEGSVETRDQVADGFRLDLENAARGVAGHDES